jgi:hypothetical protein
MRLTLAAALLAALGLAGCGEYEPSQRRGRSAAPEAVGVAIEDVSSVPPKRAPGADTANSDTPKPDSSVGRPAPQENVARKKAEVGVGKKGDYRPGLITTPLRAYWKAQERIAFEIQIRHALDLYKATNGNFPKTQEEFDQQIIKANMIKLPELPQGHRYVYDPEQGELMVEYPRR